MSPHSKKCHRSITVSVEKAFFFPISQNLPEIIFFYFCKIRNNILCLLQVSPAVLYTLLLYPQTPPIKTKKT